MATKCEPGRRAAEAQSDDESVVVPLGARTVGENSGSLTLTIPKDTARGVGVEPGDTMQVGYDPVNEEFRYVEADEFDGW
ncbi:hypothetical protein [Haloparvum sedimenti]|uniref:hypothetical protein n=1 Tax=Haloparvum sedimenti TaxID=1678448 RepID=UPI00071E86D0|nr:hypothetical protein [Haloparvum sedimenti]